MKIKKSKILMVLIAIISTIMLSTSVLATNEENSANSIPMLLYRTHVENIGWQNYVSSEQTAGTSGQSLRLEGINIKLDNKESNLSVKYQVHVQNIGWQDWKKDDEMAGTSGQSLRLEGIKIILDDSSNYSIMYRVHVQNIGWQEWKKDGEMAGTEGRSLRLEAIQIKITEKPTVGRLYLDTPTNGETYYKYENQKINVSGWKMANKANSYIKAYVDNTQINSNLITSVKRQDVLNAIKGYGTQNENPKPGFKFEIDASNYNAGSHKIKIELYSDDKKLAETAGTFNIDENIHIKMQTHVENIGWQNWKNEGEIAGTIGNSLRVEALKIQLYNNTQSNIHVKYRTHVQNIGWQDWKTDGQMAGTEGQSLRVEAVEIKLEGIGNYIVEYKAHVENVGWQQWASSEMIAGTVEQSLRVEAIQARIIKAEDTVVPQIKYSYYTTKNNWSSYIKNGAKAGNEASGINLEGLKIALENVVNGVNIKYRAHVQYVGWMDYVSSNAQAGVLGPNRAIEAVEIELEGLTGYSVEYRAYVNGNGWQDWVRDGDTAGTTGESKQISAIQIRINIDAYPHRNLAIKKIDSSKYPLYKELLQQLEKSHPTWNFELLYTGLNFNDAVYGEYTNHGANLVHSSSGSEWICNICGRKVYDTGNWYCASSKAIAYYMDPRNFLNENNVFQFLDANKYEPSSVSLSGIQANINGTFLQAYANDINTACRNQGVNPYYVISRLIQENGKNGSSTSRGMDGGNGRTYYNPFNIGAYKTENASVYQNALSRAMSNGWDTMEKALEGGIVFLKDNWLENYQNTLYQNRFDIDSTNGTALYSHQYMQNLSGAYSEANLLRGYYSNAGKIDSNLTFIIPMYEGMSSTTSTRP